MFTVIQSFFEAIAKIMSLYETKVNNQCETEILKNKRSLQKKSDKQEDLLIDTVKLLLKYEQYMTQKDRLKVRYFIKKIKGVN